MPERTGLIKALALLKGILSAASGTLTVPANKVQATFEIEIKGDPTAQRQDNLEFALQLSNPKLCVLGVSSAKGVIITENGASYQGKIACRQRYLARALDARNYIPTVGWPACGEIDIMELIGTYPGRSHGTMHWKPVNGTNTSRATEYNLASGNFSQQFHVFSVLWVQHIIKWYIDDQLFLTATSDDVGAANYPFNSDHFFIFNVAVGGNWPGPPDANTVFPQRMFVDYVRVFQ